MAQLRHDYAAFQALNAEVLVVVPNGPWSIGKYIQATDTPYPILSDKGSRVAAQYGIATRRIPLANFAAFKPSMFLVDPAGCILYASYLTSYVKEPDNQEPLAVLARLAL